jgi:hypothetical protein
LIARCASDLKLRLGRKHVADDIATIKAACRDDRGLSHIDDLQDAIAVHRPAKARIATRLAGPRVGAFWKPGDPALISLPRPAWLGAR